MSGAVVDSAVAAKLIAAAEASRDRVLGELAAEQTRCRQAVEAAELADKVRRCVEQDRDRLLRELAQVRALAESQELLIGELRARVDELESKADEAWSAS